MKKVVILMGGTSTEFVISLVSGKSVYENIDKTLFYVKVVIITPDGNWLIPKNFNTILPKMEINPDGSNYETFIKEFVSLNKMISTHGINIQELNCDVVFNALHGGEGENGTIQGLLDSFKIPYTGSGILASALAMDKQRANQIFSQVGFDVPRFLKVSKKEFLHKKENVIQEIDFPYPIFLKSNFGGSSVGISYVKKEGDLLFSLEKLLETCNDVLIQEAVSGTEVSCGVLEEFIDNTLQYTALPPTEIVSENEYFDYTAKYAGKSQEITPARLKPEETNKVQSLSILAHKTLGCKGYSRTDFILQNAKFYILETNTLPGLTEASLLPQQANCIGKNLKSVIKILIENTLSHYEDS